MLCPSCFMSSPCALAPANNAAHLLPGQPALPGSIRGVLRYEALPGGLDQVLGSLEQLDMSQFAAKARELYALNPFILPPPPPE